MTDAEEVWVDPLDGEYELRVTSRARGDLRADRCAAGDLTAISAASDWGRLVSKFADLRSRNPRGTEAPLSKVHRPDIDKLDGEDGQRAVTWHDIEHGVVWLLGFTPSHDYTLFEDRARAGDLMPSPHDYEELQDDRSATWLLLRVSRSLEALVAAASSDHGVEHRAALAGVIRTEALVVSSVPRRLHVRFRLPPMQKGVLPRYFPWALVAAIPGVDLSTIIDVPFPGTPVAGAVSVVCELEQPITLRGRAAPTTDG